MPLSLQFVGIDVENIYASAEDTIGSWTVRGCTRYEWHCECIV